MRLGTSAETFRGWTRTADLPHIAALRTGAVAQLRSRESDLLVDERIDLAPLRPFRVDGRVRIGPQRDGGYVVVDGVAANADVLVTYGVGWDTAFELDFRDRYGARVLMFDPTMFPESWVRTWAAARSPRELWRIFKRWRFIRSWARERRRQGLVVIEEGIAAKTRARYATLRDHFERYELNDKDVFLKIDIEGNEFDVLMDGDMPELRSVSQMVIELHGLETRWHDIELILRTTLRDFSIVHVHGNNFAPRFEVAEKMVPQVIELTLVRDDVLGAAEPSREPLPLPDLDFPNRRSLPDYELSFLTSG